MSLAACSTVVSIEPTILPSEAVAVPQLVGDWVNMDDDDMTRIHVRRGVDSTTYVVEVGNEVRIRSVSLGRPTLSLRLVPLAEGFLAEASPLEADVNEEAPKRGYGDPLLDSLQRRYGALTRPMYIVTVARFVGDDLQVAGLSSSTLTETLEAGRCPEPGRVMKQGDDLILLGDTRQLRRTIDCFLAVPNALDQPPSLLRRSRVRPRPPR